MDVRPLSSPCRPVALSPCRPFALIPKDDLRVVGTPLSFLAPLSGGPEQGAQACMDGSAAYRSLGRLGLGYDHIRTVMLGSEVPAHVSMAGVRRFASLIKRWIFWYPSRLGPAGSSGRLPGRVRVPLQRPHIELARDAVLQTDPAGRGHEGHRAKRHGACNLATISLPVSIESPGAFDDRYYRPRHPVRPT